MKRGRKPVDLTGRKVGKLTPRAPTPERKGGGVVWLCDCDCGQRAEVSAGQLTRKKPTSSCGCLKEVPKNKAVGDAYFAAFRAGKSVRTIAAESGTTTSNVYSCLNRRGLRFSRLTPQGDGYTAEFVSGSSPKDVAARHGVCVETIYQCLRRRGYVCLAGEWRKVGDKEFIRKSGSAAGKAPSNSIE